MSGQPSGFTSQSGDSPPSSARAVLDIRGLCLEFPTYQGALRALSDIDLQIAPGEIVALVGESGSGKSVAAMAAIRLMPPQVSRITTGSIELMGCNVLAASERSLARMRGKQVSMVFQEPMSALNPTIRIGEQIQQVLLRHEPIDRATAGQRVLGLLAEMHVADPARVMRSYPFELSGGMRQRVLIAMAFACNPQLLIADEPTTALDVTVQAQVLTLIRERARARGTAVLLITHDLAVVSQLCTRVYVMYAGQIVEHGNTSNVLSQPQHPYTRALLQSRPESVVPGSRLQSISGTVPNLLHPPRGCRFRDRCEIAQDRCQQPPPFATSTDATPHAAACWYADVIPVTTPHPSMAPVARAPAANPPPDVRDTLVPLVSLEAVEKQFAVGRSWGGRPLVTVHALNGVDLELHRGETLAIVGESGCGKSTLAQLVMALSHPTEGRVRFDGRDLRGLTPQQMRKTRQRLQMVFQDPQASLDPRMRAWRIISEPLLVARGLRTQELRKRATELANRVGIRDEQLDRYPHEFSGGQRQRLAIARALALEPELLVLDEPTSALDVSIQAQILNLLMDLQSRLGLTYLFISHNVGVVRHIADRVAVMYLGQIVELGPASLILEDPRHPYTRQLIEAVPRLGRILQEAQEPNSQTEPRSNLTLPTGCYFRPRCTLAVPACAAAQVLTRLQDGRLVRCNRAESAPSRKAPT